jgi:hypothetical protein
MADPRGTLTLTAGGKEYRLHIGMSVLADLQAKHGLDVMQQLEAPPGAGPQWLAALARYHADEADRWLVDDLLAENADAFGALMAASFPDAKADAGNPKRPRRAA